jgi:hypothetical protein
VQPKSKENLRRQVNIMGRLMFGGGLTGVMAWVGVASIPRNHVPMWGTGLALLIAVTLLGLAVWIVGAILDPGPPAGPPGATGPTGPPGRPPVTPFGGGIGVPT